MNEHIVKEMLKEKIELEDKEIISILIDYDQTKAYVLVSTEEGTNLYVYEMSREEAYLEALVTTHLNLEEESTKHLHKEIGYWIRKEFSNNWGGHNVPEWTMTDIEDYAKKEVSRYGEWVMEENSYVNDYKTAGATHVIRCLTGSPMDYCEGIDLAIKLEGDKFELVNELDGPDLQGAEWDEAKEWLRHIGEPIDA